MDEFSRNEGPKTLSLAEHRAKSLRTVETVFAAVVLVCVLCALGVHVYGAALALPPGAPRPIAIAFLSIAILDLVVLLGCQAWLTRGRD